MLPAPLVAGIEKWSHDGRSSSRSVPRETIRGPDSGALRSVFAMHELSRRFDELTRDPRLLGIARQRLGGDVYLHQSRINDKFAFQGSGFNWHSDFETWHAEDGMPRRRAVSASLMLTDNNEFNGPWITPVLRAVCRQHA